MIIQQKTGTGYKNFLRIDTGTFQEVNIVRVGAKMGALKMQDRKMQD